ncbi:lytic transglycosylase domain-containing protein [uncultured Desulfosarcina sp.]|uniref:lytic transglycosylase domain-containing protein n=1 Tax=uncultured Desulfosarcina sp. TaxID=218289 RepID=UPI0029C8475A|nr:lytic transglycosylase domain-containing protein [uncultured Desulfosarcina sp.]
MSLTIYFSNKASLFKDAVVFCVTVATCTVLLTVACTASKPAAITTSPLPELIQLQPPAPLVLPPEPAAVASRERASERDPARAMSDAVPVRGQAAAVSMIASAADSALPGENLPFHGIIMQAAGRYEVDPYLVRAIIFAESGFNPRAKSKKGARGLMQLMPSTAKALGIRDIYDPKENIDGGVRYFRLLLDRFDGDVQLALAAYNAGSRHVRNYEGVPPFKATRRYIKKVLKFQEKFKLQAKAGFRRLA